MIAQLFNLLIGPIVVIGIPLASTAWIIKVATSEIEIDG
jgi:hypothetical protein